jgi:hypothetical protein
MIAFTTTTIIRTNPRMLVDDPDPWQSSSRPVAGSTLHEDGVKVALPRRRKRERPSPQG